MDLIPVFERYSREQGLTDSMVQRTSLALRRGGVMTMERLRELYRERPEALYTLRDIGPKRMALIEDILRFYEKSSTTE